MNQIDLAESLAKTVLSAPRTVRLVVAGNQFDFDILRLGQVYPHNILGALAARSNEVDAGVPVVRAELDLLAVRTAYAYYVHGVVIVPSTPDARDILSLTCDYLGMGELAERVDASCAALSEQNPPGGSEPFVGPGSDVARAAATTSTSTTSTSVTTTTTNTTMTSTTTSTSVTTSTTTDTSEKDSAFIELSEGAGRSTAREPIPLITRPTCALSPDDEAILRTETKLRVALARPAATVAVPVIDILAADKTFRDAAGDPDVPYTLALARGAGCREWVETVEEFEENLWALSYGVLDSRMPSALVLAGGAALRCLARLAPTPENICKRFRSFADVTPTDNADNIAGAFSRARIGFGRNQARPPRLSAEQLGVFGRLIAMHGHTFYCNRWDLTFPGVEAHLNQLRKQPFSRGDIDLFLVSADPAEILAAIRYVHERMVSAHGVVAIVRTEGAVSFVPRSPHAPSVQIVLRAYKSLGQVLLGFDIDACCVGYDGERVVGTERSLRAIRRGYNLVDLTRLSPTYELRLVKYLKRGFHIAMTEPSLETHLRQLTEILNANRQLALYSALIGISRLAYALIAEWRLLASSCPLRRVVVGDYSYGSLGRLVSSMRDGIAKTDFVLGTSLNNVLFGSVSEEPAWLDRRKTWRQRAVLKPSELGPVRIRVTAVTAQGDGDALFTGSFNPIQLAWYKGGVRLPDSLASFACRRPDPASLYAQPAFGSGIALATPAELPGESSRSRPPKPSGDEGSETDGEGEDKDFEPFPAVAQPETESDSGEF